VPLICQWCSDKQDLGAVMQDGEFDPEKKKKQWLMIVVVQGWDEGQGALLPPLLPVVSADQGLMMDVYWTACCYWQMIAQRKVTLSRCLATILNPKKKIPVGGFCYNINALLADKMAHLRATSWPLLWNSEAFICLSTDFLFFLFFFSTS